MEVKNKARNYSGDLAISDIQEMVHKAHMEDIYVLLAYTGKDKDVPNAQKIFGRNFAKVQSLEHFSELMGKNDSGGNSKNVNKVKILPVDKSKDLSVDKKQKESNQRPESGYTLTVLRIAL